MKKIFQNKRNIVIVISIFLMLTTFAIIKKVTSNNYQNIHMNIAIKTVDLDNNEQVYTITYHGSKKYATVNLNTSSNTIYVKKNELLFAEKNKFKVIDSQLNYGDFYKIVNSIPLKNRLSEEDDEIVYNSQVDANIVKSLTEAIFLGKQIRQQTYALIKVKDGFIKEFNLNLSNVDNYKIISLNAVFEILPKTNIKKMNVYKELTEKTSIEELYLIK